MPPAGCRPLSTGCCAYAQATHVEQTVQSSIARRCWPGLRQPGGDHRGQRRAHHARSACRRFGRPGSEQVFQNLISNAIKYAREEFRRKFTSPRARMATAGYFRCATTVWASTRPARECLPGFPAPARPGDSGQRNRPGAVQENRRSPRRDHLGGIRAGPRIDVLFPHPAGAA